MRFDKNRASFLSKVSAALLTLALAVPACTPALAADLTHSPTATGVVRSAHTQDVLAPFSGTLLPFDWETGDAVHAGDVLLEMDTTPVYAPFSGTLSVLFAAAGDDAQSVSARYGCIAAIEPENPYLLNATTQGAYDDPDNKYIHIGEKLYFKATSTERVKGEGRVIAVNGNAYQVEVTAGDLEIGESVTLYRDPLYDRESVVGRGTCAAADPVPVQASGRVLAVHVKEGDPVNAGDLLFDTVGADAAPTLSSAQFTAPFDGAISAVNVISGQQAAKGQVLMTLADTSDLEVTCEVDEIDLSALRTGDVLSIVFDFAADTVYQGTITDISSVGAVKQNAAYYTVTLSIGDVPGLRLGMSATVYLAK